MGIWRTQVNPLQQKKSRMMVTCPLPPPRLLRADLPQEAEVGCSDPPLCSPQRVDTLPPSLGKARAASSWAKGLLPWGGDRRKPLYLPTSIQQPLCWDGRPVVPTPVASLPVVSVLLSDIHLRPLTPGPSSSTQALFGAGTW